MNDNIIVPKLLDKKSNTVHITAMPGLVNRTPIVGARSYYRSRAFTPQTSVNSLITAASSLIKINSQLKSLQSYNDVPKLYESLVHEINAFESNCQNQGIRADAILVARFVLCTFIDETILHTRWGVAANWQQTRLLSTFQRDANTDERFFLILDRISEEPAEHVELLELMYLCLSLGFEGKFRHIERGVIELDKITDELYQRIRSQRDDTKPLLLAAPPSTVAPTKTKKNLWTHLWMIMLAAVIIIAITFYGLNYFLETAATPVAKELQQINHANNT